jgi:hypothetical protein
MLFFALLSAIYVFIQLSLLMPILATSVSNGVNKNLHVSLITLQNVCDGGYSQCPRGNDICCDWNSDCACDQNCAGAPSRGCAYITNYPPTPQPNPSPTRFPTSQPSANPTQPSSQPSMQPTVQPMSRPSVQPTSEPSSPSMQPSKQPTSKPSSQPSMQPSEIPSSQPIGHPTMYPSSQPSSQPSSRPTSQPTKISTLTNEGKIALYVCFLVVLPAIIAGFYYANKKFGLSIFKTCCMIWGGYREEEDDEEDVEGKDINDIVFLEDDSNVHDDSDALKKENLSSEI